MSGVDLTGRVAVVTGGASGIGRSTAILLAEHGARVVVADYSLLAENDGSYAELGIEQRQCDVRREANLAELMDFAAEATGRIDMLVNNAGIGMVKQVGDVSEEDWDRCIDTNVKAAFFGAKHAIRHMTGEAGRGGSIVNVSSNAGILPRAHDPVYSISKLALSGLTKSLALCHAPDCIRVNAVCPGPVGGTRMIESEIEMAGDRDAAIARLIAASPMAQGYGRMIETDEIAAAIFYLCSDAAAMVTGTLIAIDGGKSLGVPPKIDS